MDNVTTPPSDMGSRYRGPPPPFTVETYIIIMACFQVVIACTISGCGMVTNIINIIVFFKQGIMSDSCTPVLAGMAVSDLFTCLHALWGGILTGIVLYENISKYSWSIFWFSSYTGLIPRIYWTMVTCWLTAYVAIERCVSVVFAFKARFIFTPKRSVISTILLYVILFALLSPSLFARLPITIKIPPLNKTYVTYTDDLVISDEADFIVSVYSIVLRLTAIALVVICNIIIFWKVKLSNKFRAKMSASKTVKNSSATTDTKGQEKASALKTDSKETKLMRMIVIICIVFFLSYIPKVFSIVVTETTFHPAVNDIVMAVSACTQTFSAVINIVIYYTMSSKYKNAFRGILCGKQTK